jgi:phosphoserine phosphatase RsbX
MSDVDVRSAPLVEWAYAGSPLEGDESGDAHLAELLPHGAFFAVIDGLGHGPEAARAARAATAIIRENMALPLSEIVTACHDGLRPTRGAVMSLAMLDFESSTIHWCGVGNVEGAIFPGSSSRRARDSIVLRGGVVGYRLPPLKVSSVSLRPRDMLVMVTDGIRSEFSAEVDATADVQLVADTILQRCGKGTDDALVLVARYQGAHHA